MIKSSHFVCFAYFGFLLVSFQKFEYLFIHDNFDMPNLDWAFFRLLKVDRKKTLFFNSHLTVFCSIPFFIMCVLRLVALRWMKSMNINCTEKKTPLDLFFSFPDLSWQQRKLFLTGEKKNAPFPYYYFFFGSITKYTS